MKIRKGEVILFISPNDWLRFKKAGWTKVQVTSKSYTTEYYKNKKAMKGLNKDAE